MIRLFIVAVVFGGLLSVMVQAQTLTFTTSYDEGTHQTINQRLFAQDVSLASLNTLNFSVTTSGDPYSGFALFEAVAEGEIDVGEVILSSLAPLDPVFLIDNLPLVVEDYDEARALWEQTRPRVEALLRDQGVVLLYTVPWPPQGLYTKNAVRDVSELSGQDIRSYSSMTAAVIEALGSNPVDVAFGDVAEAFASGTIDAMITSVSTGISSEAWHYAPVYTKAILWIPKNVVFMNAEAFDALTPDQQQAINRYAQVAEERGWRLGREEYFRSLISLADNGMRVRSPSRALQSQLAATGRQVTEQWLASRPAELQLLIQPFLDN
ncbi:MAG: TRAP transporter substrate-binding protein [Saccharospirillum sp.]